MTKKDVKKLASLTAIGSEDIGFTVGDEIITVKVLKTIPIADRMGFVDAVVSCAFIDEEHTTKDDEGNDVRVVTAPDSIFMPVNRQFAWDIYILHYFAGFPLETPEDMRCASKVADNLTIMGRIKSVINSSVLAGLSKCVDDGIAYKQMQLTAYATNELAKFNTINEFASQYVNSSAFRDDLERVSTDRDKVFEIASKLHIIKNEE